LVPDPGLIGHRRGRRRRRARMCHRGLRGGGPGRTGRPHAL